MSLYPGMCCSCPQPLAASPSPCGPFASGVFLGMLSSGRRWLGGLQGAEKALGGDTGCTTALGAGPAQRRIPLVAPTLGVQMLLRRRLRWATPREKPISLLLPFSGEGQQG